jgi:hypothetical protein
MSGGGFEKAYGRSADPSKPLWWHSNTKKTAGRISIHCCGSPAACSLMTSLGWDRPGIRATGTLAWILRETDEP